MGLMLGVIMVLSIVEHMLPPLPFLPPSVKLGLSNVITMYCVFSFGKKEAVGLAALKSCFILLIRGPIAGLLSICGGMLSILTIILLILLLGSRLSYITAGICGAVMHNIGQMIAVSFIMNTSMIFYYLPVLLVSGIFLGTVTGTMLKVMLPIFQRTSQVISYQKDNLSDDTDWE